MSLQCKLDEFGWQLFYVIFVICVVVWVINIGYFVDSVYGGFWLCGVVYYFKIVVVLVVVVIFEGFLVVIIICLVLGMWCMVCKNVIV